MSDEGSEGFPPYLKVVFVLVALVILFVIGTDIIELASAV